MMVPETLHVFSLSIVNQNGREMIQSGHRKISVNSQFLEIPLIVYSAGMSTLNWYEYILLVLYNCFVLAKFQTSRAP